MINIKKILWRGSTLQSLALIILPLTILLVVISLVSFSIHQNAMRSVVGERDERSAQSAASAIESEIKYRLYAIRSLSVFASIDQLESLKAIQASSESLLEDFDYGTAFFQLDGTNLASNGDLDFWQSLAGSEELTSLLNSITFPAVSAVFVYPKDGKQIVLVSSAIKDNNMIAVGAFSPETLIQHKLEEIYPPGGETAIYVIDSTYQILYHSGPTTLTGNPERHPGVSEAFKGQSGTTYKKVDRDEHVVAYSPIQTVNWVIVTEESWELVSSPTLRASQVIPLTMVPALLLAVLALWFGAKQIVHPLQELELKAAKLAWGNFQEINIPVGGIAEIRDLQNELGHMAGQLQAAQKSLHSYIGAITQGQEAERLRLARELHDDTIQSLIALKQRVQLARMPRKKESPASELDELEDLIEQTIIDLRRTTRALRPIYLEDLGLVAALDMLAHESSESSAVPVDFQSFGLERRLPAEAELALYRMVQEALNNAVRHSQASHISIRVEFNPQAVNLEIRDNGQGFEVPKTPTEFAPQSHFGLLGLYERSELIGASLEISSSPGKGASLKIYLPNPIYK